MNRISNLINCRFLLGAVFFLGVFFFSPSISFAADRYWVGGTANWDTSTARWSATSGGASGASVPTATDNCFFDAASGAVTVTVSVAARTCLNADFTGFTGTLAGSQTLNISGGLTLSAGMTRTYTGAITFNATSGTNVITSNGITLASAITFNGTGGTWQLADTFTNSGNLTLTAGTFNANGQTVVLNGTSQTLTGSFTFANLTRTGSAAASTLILANDITVTGTLTLNGNNATANRLSLQTSSRGGSSYTVSAGVLSATNLDVENITAGGAANWDISAITGLSGDRGGNTGITFTPAGTSYWVGDGGNFSDTAHWASTSGGSGGTARMPLVQDTARFDANSFTIAGQTVTYDVANVGTIDWSGVTNNPEWINSVLVCSYGSVTHDSGMSINASTAFSFNFCGYGNHTITNDGVIWPTDKAFAVLAAGTYTLMDDLSGGWFRVRGGTFDANGHNVTIRSGGASQQLVVSGTTNLNPARTLKMGSGTWEFANIGTYWNSNPYDGNLAIVPGTATIKVTGTGLQTMQIDGGQTYPNFWNATAGEITRFTVTGGTGNATWNDIKIDPGNTHQFTSGTTTTLSSLTATGTADDMVTIGSTGGTVHNLVKAGSGVVSIDYANISNSVVSPANTWYAGTHSFDGGGNVGWIFTDPPVEETITSSGSRPSVRANTSTEKPAVSPANPSNPTTPTPSSPYLCVINSNVLKITYRGPGVSCLQRKLNILLSLNLATDGIFGPSTQQAVVNFQTKNNLTPDGIVGPQTKSKLP